MGKENHAEISMIYNTENVEATARKNHRATHSDKESSSKMNQLLAILGLLDTSAEDIFHAISSDTSDFEDAVMIETARRFAQLNSLYCVCGSCDTVMLMCRRYVHTCKSSS
ncbi:MAG: hypothetical protein LUF78_03890 [Clostridiales bacterium]|nr:hypothetical protein [Clostridiales bacterium]